MREWGWGTETARSHDAGKYLSQYRALREHRHIEARPHVYEGATVFQFPSIGEAD